MKPNVKRNSNSCPIEKYWISILVIINSWKNNWLIHEKKVKQFDKKIVQIKNEIILISWASPVIIKKY